MTRSVTRSPRLRVRHIAAAAATAMLAAGAARAADLDDSFLRGSFSNDNRVVSWEGIVLGGQVGYSNLNADPGDASSSVVANSLRNTTVEDEFAPQNWVSLPKSSTSATQYGAFLGYNMQWDRLVLGVDLAYNHPSTMETSSVDAIGRQVTTSDNVVHDVYINSSSYLKLRDYATFRARAGYAFGQFLPYAVLGAAVGRFNYSVSATTVDNWTPSGSTTTTYTQDTGTDSKDGAFAAGFVTGLGLDVALLPNVFLRAEWEYIIFAPVGGIKSTLNTGRVGLGLRF